MNGESNPEFQDTLIFPNDFPALLGPNPVTHPERDTTASSTNENMSGDDLFQTQPTFGTCKVLTYSPRHDLTLALMSPLEITKVIECWRQVYKTESKALRDAHGVDTRGAKEELSIKGMREDVGCVNIFENRGSMMGASAPHPHGQVWSTSL
jgi:UDPglucose--hexose-1-phosphate uridylyltransferase